MISTRNNAYDLSTYRFRAGEKILIDTNIWLYLFFPPRDPSDRYVAEYSAAFSSLITAKAQPILDPMVLSEYLNRYIKKIWNVEYRSSHPRFKDFRNSPDFSAAGADAASDAKRILDCCEVHATSANRLDLNAALSGFASGGVDFNDALLVDVCRQRRIKLMTHDGDFQHGGIEILTLNQNLLNACQ